MEKALVVGLNEILFKYEPRLRNEYDIVAIVDGNPQNWGKTYNGIPVGNGDMFNRFNFDVVIFTFEYRDLIIQLLQNEQFRDKVRILRPAQPNYFAYEALDILLKDYEFDTVLDIGCGEGKQTDIMLANGKHVTCIDKGESVYFKKNQHKINAIVDDFNEHEFDTQFDCIWCAHVLEHQLNVHNFLKKVHSLLKEDGVLAMTVPPPPHGRRDLQRACHVLECGTAVVQPDPCGLRLQ